MKITAKTTKGELKDFLGANISKVQKKDKGLFERLAYTSAMLEKDEKKVTRNDLAGLAKEVIKVLGDKVVTPALAEETPAETPVEVKAENSVKKLNKGVSKKQKSMEEPKEETLVEDTEEVTEEVAEKPSKTAKKTKGDKKTPKKDTGVTPLDGAENKKAIQLAKTFPPTLTVGDTNYELASDIKTMEDLHTALENDEEIVFAYYWTKRHLKQFPYFSGLLGQPKSFDNDLDLATTIYVSDENKVSYQVSMYTEALYTIIPTDMPVDEDGIRYANGMEFQVYRAVTE